MAKKEEILLTAAGYVELEQELNDLRVNKRAENVLAIKEARIQELEYKLENATIIDSKDKSTINVGCKVKILYVDDNEEDEYTIVGSL